MEIVKRERPFMYEIRLENHEKEKTLLYQTLEELEKRGFSKVEADRFVSILSAAINNSNWEGNFTAYRSEV